MHMTSVSFRTWCEQHPDTREKKWYRELYPWEVFERVDYDAGSIGLPQEIIVGGESYVATVQESYPGENGRPNYLVHLTSAPSDRRQRWEMKQWDTTFHVVAAPSGDFITLFTEKLDPGKKLLRQFMSGRLEEIELTRALPISRLLFRSLINYPATEAYGDLARFKSYPIRDLDRGHEGVGPLDVSSYEPFLSDERRLWLFDSFTEQKAHRHAIQLSGQAERIVGVYCQPTLTRHHRCSDGSCEVVSLGEFLRGLSPELHARYLGQARFLVNHLRSDERDRVEPKTSRELAELLKAPSKPLAIHTSDLREAKAGLGIVVGSTADAAYVCACANLLNAALNKKLGTYDGSLRLAKEVYSFKAVLGNAICDMVQDRLEGVEVYVEPSGPVYVTVRGVQFSFHAIPHLPDLAAYASSPTNRRQEWSGVRLQPMASLALRWARALLREEAQREGGRH